MTHVRERFTKEAGVAVDRDLQTALVLHVGERAPAEAPGSSDLVRHLHSSPQVACLSDVYRALAVLLRPGTGDHAFASSPLAVVVRVDGLRAHAFDFFRLLREGRPELLLLAYSATGQEALVQQALAAGARERATLPVLEDLIATPVPAKEEAAARVEPPRAAPSPAPAPSRVEVPPRDQLSGTVPSKPKDPPVDAPPETASASVPICAPAVDAVADDELTPVDEDELPPLDEEEAVADEIPAEVEDAGPESNNGVRVPWLRYHDRPLRVKPAAPAPPARTASENGVHAPGDKEPSRVAPARTGPPPLLTDEELRALLEDDVAALAPRGEDSREEHGRAQHS